MRKRSAETSSWKCVSIRSYVYSWKCKNYRRKKNLQVHCFWNNAFNLIQLEVLVEHLDFQVSARLEQSFHRLKNSAEASRRLLDFGVNCIGHHCFQWKNVDSPSGEQFGKFKRMAFQQQRISKECACLQACRLAIESQLILNLPKNRPLSILVHQTMGRVW